MSCLMKLLVCYHKKDILLKDDVLTPIHVGRALARSKMGEDDPNFIWMSENMIGDDTGENISEKNSSYNELTAIYWAWKNYQQLGDPEYIGLMHYRRHFIFRKGIDVVENVDGIDENYFKRINYNSDTINHLFDDCDFVAHIGRVDQVYKHYKENHHIEDLDLAIEILKKRHPEYCSTADSYLKMSNVNLCNMFIMPKKMFFEYCEWLFDILGEFEKEVDLSDKRLFISERLTGIFVEHQKRRGLRQKALSATFIQVPSRVPVVMPYKSSSFCLAVTMASILKNKKNTTSVDFYVLHNGDMQNDELEEFIKFYPGNNVKLINVKSELERIGISERLFRFPEHYPLVASEILPNLNKFLYLDERVYFFGDAMQTFLACNNDEFAILGLSKEENKSKQFLGDVFSLNAARIRRRGLITKIKESHFDLSAAEVFSELLPDQFSFFPWWTYNISDSRNDGQIFYNIKRGEKRWGVWNRSMLYFDDGMEPWKNIQALYSVYWWETAAEIPSCIQFFKADEKAIELWYDQSADFYKAKGKQVRSFKYKSAGDFDRPSCIPNQNILRKVVHYYKLHGFKSTIKKIIQKITGK